MKAYELRPRADPNANANDPPVWIGVTVTDMPTGRLVAHFAYDFNSEEQRRVFGEQCQYALRASQRVTTTPIDGMPPA